MSARTHSSHRRALLRVVAAAAIWLIVAVVVVPWIVRTAHAGRGLPLFSAMIEGRGSFTVEYYLDLWNRLALRLTAVMIVASVAIALAVRFAGHRLRRLAALLDAQPTVNAGGIVLTAILLGFAGGMIEGVLALGRALLKGNPESAPGFEVLWMAPLAASFAAFVLALPLAALRARRGLSLRIVLVCFAMLPVYSAIVGLKLGIHKYAALLLSVGIAVQFARWAAPRAKSNLRRLKIGSLAAASLIIAGIGLSTIGSKLVERVHLTSLGNEPSGAPNVLLLILDTVRAQSMSLYGYDRETTPEIDRIATAGVVFDRAISPSPWTLPGHASMFTGRWSHELSTDFDSKLDSTHGTLAEALGRHGWATAGFVANFSYCTAETGLARGFAVYRDRPVSLSNIASSSRWTRSALGFLRPRFAMRGELARATAADVNDDFLDWLDGQPDRPFFAFLNYFDAHAPYETHPPFDRKFRDEPPRFWLTHSWQRLYDEEELQERIDAYDSALAYLDHQIGRLLGELEDRGILRNTIVIITSDHGEHLGERSILSHANSLYMPLLHVPLIVVYPPGVPAGLRIEQSVTTRDLFATVLDMTGVAGGEAFTGRSLERYWSREADGARPDDSWILSELTYNTFSHVEDPIRRGPMVSLVRGTLHYIRNGDGVEELYDMQADPAETVDLSTSPEGAPALAVFRATLDSIRGPISPSGG